MAGLVLLFSSIKSSIIHSFTYIGNLCDRSLKEYQSP
jgi:hypothetical protein